MRWHVPATFASASENSVSIPKRVSDALALARFVRIAERRLEFQSLRGFPMRWHYIIYCGKDGGIVFQSLRGFPMRWHPKLISHGQAGNVFQSLRGFPMRWHPTNATDSSGGICFNP